MKRHLDFPPDYTPRDVETHFYQIGINLLEEEMDSTDPTPLTPDYEVKPVTLRLPVYQIAAIDAVAAAGEMTRQEFLGHLLISSLGAAFIGLASGFSPSTSPEQAGTDLLNSSQFMALGGVARKFLVEASFASMGHEISMTDALDKMTVGLENLEDKKDA